MIPTRAEIRRAYDAGYEAVVVLIDEALADFVERLKAQETRLKTQESRLAELERRLNQNSQNSSKPPSSDGFNRPPPRSQRKKSKRHSGGQPGHPGTTLAMVKEADHVIEHWPACCESCGMGLAEKEASAERRQVFDIPPMRLEVTEHRAMAARCAQCGVLTRGAFPKEVKPGAQYGKQVMGIGVYALAYQLLPLERTCELMWDLLGIRPSEGTLVNWVEASRERIAPIEAEIKAAIKRAPVVNLDETGARIEKRTYWLHVASTPSLTYYVFDWARAGKAFDRVGILPGFAGVGVHDALPSYLVRDFKHSLCNAHLLRDLTGLEETTRQRWPTRMKRLLITMRDAVKAAVERGANHLRSGVQQRLEAEYDRLVKRALHTNPGPTRVPGQVGRARASPAWNIAERLRRHKDAVLRFLRDFSVPFDNNLAERDLRMSKVKQKVSGCFRSLVGAQCYATIRGFISTARKQGFTALAALRAVLEGRPLALNLA